MAEFDFPLGDDPIKFHSAAANIASRGLSAFMEANFEFRGRLFTSVEHCYQYYWLEMLTNLITHRADAMGELMPQLHLQMESKIMVVHGNGPFDAGRLAKRLGRFDNFYANTQHLFRTQTAAKTVFNLAKGHFHSYNIKLMEEIVCARFHQDPWSQRLLFATGSRKLVHFDRFGSIWGSNGRNGENRYGLAVEKAREALPTRAHTPMLEM